jgi:hypothetical protein
MDAGDVDPRAGLERIRDTARRLAEKDTGRGEKPADPKPAR